MQQVTFKFSIVPMGSAPFHPSLAAKLEIMFGHVNTCWEKYTSMETRLVLNSFDVIMVS